MIFARLLKVLLVGCLNKTIYYLFLFFLNAVFNCFKYLIALYGTSAETSFLSQEQLLHFAFSLAVTHQ